MRISLIFFLMLSFFNIAIADDNELECENECCIEYYIRTTDHTSYTVGRKRIYLSDTLFIEFRFDRGRRLMGRDDYQIVKPDTFKILNGETYWLFRGVYYRYFSNHDFSLGIPMMRYSKLSSFDRIIEIHAYYPIEKIKTDTAEIYVYKFVPHGTGGTISFSTDITKMYFIPEIGFVKTENFKSGNLTSYLIEFRKSKGCDEFLDRVFNRKRE